MHVFQIDETNRNSVSGGFFIVGGLVFTDEQVKSVSEAVEQIRTRYGYEATDNLKFQTSSRPPHVALENSHAAKKEVIAALTEAKVRMLTYVVLHDIGTNQTETERMKKALNTLTYAYFRLLGEESGRGILLMDRDDSLHNHLAEMYREGVGPGHSVSARSRIDLFGMTANNQSNLSSAVDIALGGFRYCVNVAVHASPDENQQLRATEIIGGISDLLWGVVRPDGVKQVGGNGFITRPETVNVPHYRAKYDLLRQQLHEYSEAAVAMEEPAP